jgi:hypothetical protein
MSQFHGDRITHTVQHEAEEGEEEGGEEGLYEEMEGEEEQLEEDVIGEEEIEHDYEEEEYYEDEDEENMHEEIEGKLDGSSKLNGHPVANKHTTSLSPIESAKIDFQANRILVSPNETRPNDSQSIGIRELKGSSTLERDKLAMNSKDHNIRLQYETLCRKNETHDHHALNKNIEGPNNGRLSSPIDQNKDDSWGSIGEIEHQKRKDVTVFKNSEINSKNTFQNLSERKRPITLVKDGDFSFMKEKSKGDNLSNKSYEKSEQLYIPTIRPKLDDNKPSIQSKEITEDKNGGNNSLTMKPSLDFNGRNSPSNSGLMDNDSNYNKSTLKNPSKIHISDSRRFIPSSIKNFDADDKTFGPKRVPSRDLDNDSDQSGYKKDRHIGNRTDNVLQNSPSLRERDTFRMKTTLSKRSISNAEKEDMTQLTISPLLSRQPTLTMPPISKQPTPKASESTLRMEPVKALPILNSSAKQISSRETSPEANLLKHKGLQVSSIVTSPKYAPTKQKDPLVSLSKANLSKPQLRLSPVPTVNPHQEVNEMSRRPSLKLLDGPGHYPSSNRLAKFQPPTSKAVSEIESAQNKQFDRKVVQGGSQLSSRRSSKTQLAPIIGIHDNHFETPKQMVSRQVGLGYSSLNHSKLDTSLLDRSLEIDRSAYSKANTSVSNDPASGLDSKSSPVLLLAKVKEYCATNNDSKFLTLSQLEHLNETGEHLRRQLAQISSPMKDQAGSILVRASDIKRPVSNYTKSTLNYIKSRYKRDMESNNLIADAMEKELARLSDLVQKISDPRYSCLT